MQALPGLAPAAAAPSTRTGAGRRVIDAPTRMFHWLFALSFLGAYLSAEAERWRMLHVTLGYIMAGLLVFRLVYSLRGPRQVALGVLWQKLRSLPAWIAALRQRSAWNAQHARQGQNLMMGVLVLALLAAVLPLTLSGYATFNDWGDWLGGDWLEELHEVVGNTMLLLVLGHLGLITYMSVQRRRNLAMPMVTGRGPGQGPDLVKQNRGWLAALVLVAAMAFAAWQWHDSPRGLIPASVWGPSSAGDAAGDEDDD